MPRNRSLAEVNHKFLKNSSILETLLDERLAGGGDRPLNVLEVGCGHGRVLTELAIRYHGKPVVFHGVTLERRPPITCDEDLIELARRLHLADEAQLERLTPPHVYFYDASKLHFDDESLDFIYSMVTIRFMDHKARFLEEACRVLKPGGSALLDLNEPGWDYPYGPAEEGRRLTPYINRFVLRSGDKLIPLAAYLKLFEGECFRFEFLAGKRCVLKLRKLQAGKLDLKLSYNDDLSASMHDFAYVDERGHERGGFRTVYDVRPGELKALTRLGLL